MNENYYAVIMAGGVGSRFWPVSTPEFPKQFHDMLGTGETLLQRTYNRLAKLIPGKNILVLTNEAYRLLVLEQLPQLQSDQVLLEPAMRNTAPCILYAALKLWKKNEKALMLVAPSDHWIEDEETFRSDVQKVFFQCDQKPVLMTLGIQPVFPNTGYGYIEYEKEGENEIKKVNRFCEKPDYETAKKFIKQGNFLWNAGIFAWKVADILQAFRNFQSDMYELFEKGTPFFNTEQEDGFIQQNYSAAANISIDYAIMEQASNVEVLPAGFDWNDLGTWGSLYEKLEKDSSRNAIVNATVLVEDATGNIIRTRKGKTVVVDGLHNYIIVDEGDKLLILPKEKEQEIKNIATRFAGN